MCRAFAYNNQKQIRAESGGNMSNNFTVEEEGDWKYPGTSHYVLYLFR